MHLQLRNLKPFFALLLLLTQFHTIRCQDHQQKWEGAGVYLSGEMMATMMNKLAADKKISLVADGTQNIIGQMIISYDKSREKINSGSYNQVFRVTGKLDTTSATLLLVVTHLLNDDSGKAIPFKKADSIFYHFKMTRLPGKLMINARVDPIRTKNPGVEWIGSSSGKGFGMNISDDLNMHVLPLAIRMEADVDTSIRTNKTTESLLTERPVKRKIKIARTIVLDSPRIQISAYDNGIVDGDMISLILDGNPILSRKTISTVPVSLDLTLSKNLTEHLLELFAENLGSIPPNTALIVILCNHKRYEMILSSDMNVNESVKLVLRSGQ